MKLLARVARHVRLSLQAAARRRGQTPPFLILFVNSLCNLTCEHCFYWRNLNRRDDLTFDEIERLSRELGRVENLNLSGGEPFLRPDLADVCTLFIVNNGAANIYIPTNGYFTERTTDQVRRVLQQRSLSHLVIELSLDGTADYHDRFRGNPRSFDRAMQTYEALAELRRHDSRLGIHANSTVTNQNVDEVRRLSAYLHQRCPAIEHHTLALVRGDRKNPTLLRPAPAASATLYAEVETLWADRQAARFGSVVEPLLQWAKARTVASERQFVPCTAGNLTGVVYANGDVSVCESHPPLGNLRQRSFRAIWESVEARALRGRIRARRCHCTNEVFLWPSVVFQPAQLARAFVGSRLPLPLLKEARAC